MEKDITIIFHNRGLRSYIEVDLCAECPRQDDKGCCGYYSPIFYPTDLAYLLVHQPELLDYIFSLDHLTILDASVTVNSTIEGSSYRCRFHSKETGCILTQSLRESICRHFVCSGIGWWEDEALQDWYAFFNKLTDYEIELNHRWSECLKEQGLSLRDTSLRERFFTELRRLYAQDISPPPDFITVMPREDTRTLKRSLRFGADWIL